MKTFDEACTEIANCAKQRNEFRQEATTFIFNPSNDLIKVFEDFIAAVLIAGIKLNSSTASLITKTATIGFFLGMKVGQEMEKGDFVTEMEKMTNA